MSWKQRFVEYLDRHTVKYRTRSARMKFWWSRGAPVSFGMGLGIEIIKFRRNPNCMYY